MGSKITQLTSATSITGNELVPLVQDGTTKKVASILLKTTNAADLTTGVISNARLPIGSTTSAGALQIGTTSGTACDGADSRLSNSRPPSGSASGDLTGSYPNPSLAASGVSAGVYGSATTSPQIVVDSKGRITSASSQAIPIPQASVNNPLSVGIANPGTSSAFSREDHVHPAPSTTLTGDVTGTGVGNVAATLSNTGVTQGTYGSATQVPVVTVDTKGRVVAASSTNVSLPDSGVAPGVYGTAYEIPQVTINSKGVITNVAPVPVGYTGTVSSVDASGGNTGLAFTGGPVTSTGILTLTGTLALQHGGTGVTTQAAALEALGAVPAATVGVPNGIAQLGNDGKIVPSQFPPLTTEQITSISTTAINNFTQSVIDLSPVKSVAGKTGIVTLTTSDIQGYQAGGVTSVAGRTGAVTLTTADIASFSSSASAASPVQSVAGRTGSISLTTADIAGYSNSSNIDGGSASIAGGIVQARRDTSANWTSSNPVLQSGLIGFETDTGKIKIGDGTLNWQSLDYFVPTQYKIDYIVVAGGGGGGQPEGDYFGAAGGGGGGGIIFGNQLVVSGSSNQVIIGAGGSGGSIIGVSPNWTRTAATQGNNSSFLSLTSIGGGFGGGNNQYGSPPYSGNGGSGGGGCAVSSFRAQQSTSLGGSGTSGQGYGGGDGSFVAANSFNYPAAGGGGYSQVGFSPSPVSGGAGGNGGSGYLWVNGSYYSGGGGGGAVSSGPPGSGGIGGGGNGSGSATASNGSVNTGGGGGGGRNFNASGPGSGSGGSGVVIIRYYGQQKASGGSVTSVNGYTYHTFTSSGTFIA